MQKIISVIFLFIIFLSVPLYSPAFAENNNSLLSRIENDFYGYDYSKDTVQNRITRLEKAVYGKTSSGDINKRIKKLSNDISADVIGLEIEPVKDTFLAQDEAKADSTVDYPIIDKIEMQLFNETHKNMDFHTRIVKIEKKLFGKVYDVDDYSKRMDRIKENIMPETIAKKNEDYNNFSTYGDGSYYNDSMINSMDLSGTKGNRFSHMFGQRNYTRPYTNFGSYGSGNNDFSNNDYFNSRQILNNGTLEDNLAQMEYDMFGTEFSNETTENRIKRLNSVNKAKKSSKKYDSQKFSQHMSTAMEIGAMLLMILAMVL